MRKAEYKIPGGKLIAVELKLSKSTIAYIKISGDFFMHPEESILDLEKQLKGVQINDFQKYINNFFLEKNIILYGIKPEDFKKVIKMALDD
jgi:hypothetical protein